MAEENKRMMEEKEKLLVRIHTPFSGVVRNGEYGGVWEGLLMFVYTGCLCGGAGAGA
jgi:hypothetical protein